jgi:hypothetical protein
MDYEFQCEGHRVRLMGEGPFRRWFCDCAAYGARTRMSGIAHCRHTQIISGRLAGHEIKSNPVRPTATIIQFAPKLRALKERRQKRR